MVSVPRFQPVSIRRANAPAAFIPQGLANPAALGQQFTDTAAQIAFEEQAKKDKRVALDAVRLARKDADDLWYGEEGGRWKEGQEFFEWSTGASDSLDKAIQARTQTLAGPQNEIAQSYMDDIRDRFGQNVQQRSGAARQTMYEGGYSVDKENLLNTHSLSAGDPDATIADLQAGLDEGAELVASFMDEHPEYIDIDPTLWAREQVEGYESTLIRTSIEKVLEHGNSQLAKDYFDEFGHLLSSTDQSAVKSSLDGSQSMSEVSAAYDVTAGLVPIYVGGDARQVAETAGQKFLSPTAAMNERSKLLRAHGKDNGWSEEQIREAVDYNRRRSKEVIETQEAQQAAMYTELDNFLLKNEGDMVLLRERFPSAYAHVSSEQKSALSSRASDMAEGRVATRDANEWRLLDGLAHGSIEDQDAFITRMRSAVPRSLLSEDHLKIADKWVEDIQQGRADALDDGRSWNQRVESKIKALKLNAEDADLFHQSASAARANMAVDFQRSGKLITAQDEQTLINIQTWEELFDSQGRPVELSDHFFRLTVADIPDPPPAWISRGGGQALAENGIPQTPANLKALYFLDIQQNGSLTQQRIPPEVKAKQERLAAEADGNDNVVPLPKTQPSSPRALTSRGRPGAADEARMRLATTGQEETLNQRIARAGQAAGGRAVGADASFDDLRSRRSAVRDAVVDTVLSSDISDEELLALRPDVIEALQRTAGIKGASPASKALTAIIDIPFSGAEFLFGGVADTFDPERKKGRRRAKITSLRRLINDARSKRGK
jgi:hypothetical protein